MLQSVDGAIDFLAKRHAIELIEHGSMEALADSVGLRALGLGPRMIDVLDAEAVEPRPLASPMSTRLAHEQRLEIGQSDIMPHRISPMVIFRSLGIRKNRAAGDWAKRLKHLNVGREKPASLMAALLMHQIDTLPPRNHATMASVSFISCSVGARDRRKEETRMNMKRLILAGCSVIVLGAGTAWAGPCDTGRTANKDAGSGPASQSSSQTTGMSTDAKQHPPTETMNRASGDVAASSQDTQRQMQGQPTAAQQAEGAKPGSPMNSQEAQRQMHAQPSVAEQPKGEGQTADKGC